MAVNLKAPVALEPIAGIRLATAEAAVRKPGRQDLVILALDPGCEVVGAFTRNAFCAAPVQICRQHLATGKGIRALCINAGNANAGTGAAGLAAALACCEGLAERVGCESAQVLPFSTGVIGEALPVQRILAAMPAAVTALRPDAWVAAAHGIMTTDTVAKGFSNVVETNAGRVAVTGIAKGAGMIRPDMATLLAYVATDARLAPAALRALLAEALPRSFNAITIDGDTSTNDSIVLIATQKSGPTIDGPTHPQYRGVADAVIGVCELLAQAIVRDGEGATRFVTLEVSGARDAAEAREVADTVAHSPLVKTALFAGDANWGRILAAIGRSRIAELDVRGVSIQLDDVVLIRGGEPDAGYRDALGAAVLARPEYSIRIDLGRGTATTRVWTCDLSYDYVRINAEYRS